MRTKKFTLNVAVETEDHEIKDRCLEVLAQYLKENCGYFDVNYSSKAEELKKYGHKLRRLERVHF